MKNLRNRLVLAIRRAVVWGDRRVPPGVRSIVGVLCVIGGLVGFLPILGFWMLPVGLALIALDIPPLRRRLMAWIRRHDAADSGGPGRTEAPRLQNPRSDR
jgi:hypothetical protein